MGLDIMETGEHYYLIKIDTFTRVGVEKLKKSS